MKYSHPVVRWLAAVIVVPAVLAFAASCATTKELIVMGEADPGAGTGGWVTFITDNTSVVIKRVTGSTEGSSLRLYKGNVPIAIPCPPGENEFAVYDKAGPVERLVVPVTDGAVTCVGIRRVVLEWRWVWEGSGGWRADPVRYLVRCSIGSHPLPADPAANDPAPYFAALEDGDWATRTIAIGNLQRINPTLDERQWNTLAVLSREDSSAPVWRAAGQFFRATRNPAPAPPVVIAYFDRSLYGMSLESDTRVARSLVTQGYQIESKIEKSSFWQMLRSSSMTGWKDLEYALECSWQGGGETGAFGLAVGYDVNNFNAFCVSKEGGAAVLAYRGGSLRATPVDWSSSLADVIAASEVIRIGVSKRGTDYTMTVNGRPVGTFTDKDMRSGVVGLFVNGRQTVVYRKLVVYRPPEPFKPRK